MPRPSRSVCVFCGSRPGTRAPYAATAAELGAVLAAENFVYAISAEEQPQLLLPGTGFIYAPVVQGAEAGVAYVLLSGKAVGKIPVVYGETAEISQPEQKKPRFLFWRMQKP